MESSVVRIVPKNPRPQISWDEWDGLLRICFGRKNKTLRASFFGQRDLVDLLESNYRTYCAQNDIPLDDGPMEHDVPESADAAEDDDGAGMDIDMDEDEDEVPELFKMAKNRGSSKRKRRGKVYHLVKEKIRRVLEDETQLAEKRARQCDEGDFLRLLYAFNVEGIHFR